MAIHVSIVEDDDRIREGLAFVINSGETVRCISVYRTAEEALREIPLKKPDVVLMDINLPNMSGIECVQKLKAVMPRLHILMLTMYENKEQIFNSLMAGANGYLVKRTSAAKLIEAIEEVHRGNSPMSGKIARIVVEHIQKMKTVSPEEQLLSKRELEILDLLAKSYRYKEIAGALDISFDTVRSHLQNIYEKLHVHSRTEAVVKYLSKKASA